MELVYKYWAKAGAGISLVILCYVYFIQKNPLPLLDKFILLNLAFLMLHQAEEYIYPGTFKDYFNYRLYNPLGFFRNKLTDKGIFWVNVVLGWGMNILVFIFLRSSAPAVMTVITILFFNGLIHFFLSFKTQEYNPGVVTGAILFLPLGFYSYYKLKGNQLLSTGDVVSVLITAVIASLLIPVTIYLTREKK